jgi:hypothetical protein
MTTKRIVAILAAISLVLGLLVAVFAGDILLFVFHQAGNSDAAVIARNFLKSNERLRQDIGEVKDFGSLIRPAAVELSATGLASPYPRGCTRRCRGRSLRSPGVYFT